MNDFASQITNVRQQARQTLDQLRQQLINERNERGHWTGTLSPSSLSTATAVSAMCAVLSDSSAPPSIDSTKLRSQVEMGLRYLVGQQNDDGGFGDTDRSHSNIATSYLVLSAATLAEQHGLKSLSADQKSRLNDYLDRSGRLEGLRRRYGKDKTFVVPIMNNMAIAGLISWDEVAALPFEAAVFPQSMYRFLQMPVVSYAIPALVAIGQARHFLGKRAFAPIRMIRSLSVERTLHVLRKMQPESGGYLEATPLTAFVVMSLAATGRSRLDVVESGLRFLNESMLDDGSWPIDTNLATWVTSLSVHALSSDPEDDCSWYSDGLLDWHLSCQHRVRHPFTGAEPGGWGWTDLSGAVPDSDDTPAAILALTKMREHCVRENASEQRLRKIDSAIEMGIGWLLRLQNRNGGWPTFCRGWGKLPFDRSSTDLTAHAIRAIKAAAAADNVSADSNETVKAISQGIRFLNRQQQPDGSWLPLWFGNQDRDDESNPIYGTAKVLACGEGSAENRNQATKYLVASQNVDGGWGGGRSLVEKIHRLADNNRPPHHTESSSDRSEASKTSFDGIKVSSNLCSSVEETALAVEALSMVIWQRRLCENVTSSRFGRSQFHGEVLEQDQQAVNDPVEPSPKAGDAAAGNDEVMEAILRGVDFLVQSVRDRRHEFAWPIGFYFAKLWYHERLYPLIFATTALGKFLRASDANVSPDWPH